MTKENLRIECERLFSCKTINDCNEMLDIYAEFLLKAIINHKDETIYSDADYDAKIIVQMMLTKVLHLKNVVSGISFRTKDGLRLERIIDPTIVASFIRNIYETTAMFNLIYIHTKDKDEKTILYSLWVHAGLKYRQRFENIITSIENKQKHEEEKIMIEKIIIKINGTQLYNKLNQINKDKIKEKLKKKDYFIEFAGTEVNFLSWKDLVGIMGVKEGLLDHLYTHLSFNSHPSNVSVFQFDSMFKDGEAEFIRLTNTNLQTAFFMFSIFMFSIFIADYVKLFPTIMSTYEKIDLRDQIVIDFHNFFLRGNEYSINDSWRKVYD
ncbi:MAG: hypothetical protein HYZ54_04805 [Ignavibacteriae bacterium]|nr:hypothetical protein [Ignavibacteriota bacterium]